MSDDLRQRIINALAVADGQNLDGYDGHTMEVQYGKQADAVLAVVKADRIEELCSCGYGGQHDDINPRCDLNTHLDNR